MHLKSRQFEKSRTCTWAVGAARAEPLPAVSECSSPLKWSFRAGCRASGWANRKKARKCSRVSSSSSSFHTSLTSRRSQVDYTGKFLQTMDPCDRNRSSKERNTTLGQERPTLANPLQMKSQLGRFLDTDWRCFSIHGVENETVSLSE